MPLIISPSVIRLFVVRSYFSPISTYMLMGLRSALNSLEGRAICKCRAVVVLFFCGKKKTHAGFVKGNDSLNVM